MLSNHDIKHILGYSSLIRVQVTKSEHNKMMREQHDVTLNSKQGKLFISVTRDFGTRGNKFNNTPYSRKERGEEVKMVPLLCRKLARSPLILCTPENGAWDTCPPLVTLLIIQVLFALPVQFSLVSVDWLTLQCIFREKKIMILCIKLEKNCWFKVHLSNIVYHL